MKFPIRLLTLSGLMAAAQCFAADVAIFPTGPAPIAQEVDGRWVATDPDNVLTQEKSENALELLQRIESGETDLQLDLTGWEPPLPKTISQVVWALRYNQDAKLIKFSGSDVIAFGTSSPKTVDEAIRDLADKTAHARLIETASLNVVHYGLEKPQTIDDALAILARRIYDLEARVAALEAP